MLENCKHFVMTVALVVLVVCMIFSFFRSIIGPKIADRIVAVNMIGTQVILIICTLAVLFHEGGLIDVAIIYALFSFLAVVLFTRVYIGAYNEKQFKDGEGEHND